MGITQYLEQELDELVNLIKDAINIEGEYYLFPVIRKCIYPEEDTLVQIKLRLEVLDSSGNIYSTFKLNSTVDLEGIAFVKIHHHVCKFRKFIFNNIIHNKEAPNNLSIQQAYIVARVLSLNKNNIICNDR